ncbi:sigma-54 interaction domain-containing protein [Alkaliphilus crotonatoxidans]
MISKKMTMAILQSILHYLEEGIHVIDAEGRTIYYNQAMAELEGMEIHDVMGKRMLDVFPSLNHNTSTLIRALASDQIIENQSQTYLNNRGKEVTTLNTTIPLIDRGEHIGALEIAKNVTEIKNLSDEILKLRQRLAPPSSSGRGEIKKYTFETLKGKSPSFMKALRQARSAAATSSSVLIYGETGTGKELFAQGIHYSGVRKGRPFLAQNCAALPETLLEGILFGTAKGGFTGAIDRPGIFEQAHGGTILLDEINSMGLQLQAKLLRVLQEGYVRRVGGLKDIPIDVRIIATTNEAPLRAIERGNLRKDLYYRLNVVNITIPSLRERTEDILLLADYFINRYNKSLGKEVWMLSTEASECFLSYSWPGNVRELENVIEGAMNMIHEEHIIKPEHLPEQILAESIECQNADIQQLFNQLGTIGLDEALEALEQKMIESALEKNKGNISRAAKELGIKRQTLQHKIKKYN